MQILLFKYKNYSNREILVRPAVAVTNYDYEIKLNDEKEELKY